jgi:hypothetical protein
MMFVIAYLLCLEVAHTILGFIPKTGTEPAPYVPAFYYWLTLMPALILGVRGAFAFVDFYERRIVGMDSGYGGYRGRRHRRYR